MASHTERADYDTPWKEILELYFQPFMALCFPLIYQEIDWSKGYEFLDKELKKISRKNELGNQVVDKLIKIFRLSGEEAWVLIHLEVQGQPDQAFMERMYRYNYSL